MNTSRALLWIEDMFSIGSLSLRKSIMLNKRTAESSEQKQESEQHLAKGQEQKLQYDKSVSLVNSFSTFK